MDNNKNIPKNSPKIKKILFVMFSLALLLIGVLGAIYSPKIAYADSIEDSNSPYTTKYHPLGNAIISFDTWGRTSKDFKPTTHDYPGSIGGLLGVDDLGNTDMFESTYVRAVHNVVTDVDDFLTPLNQHIFYQNGSETITFNNAIYSGVTQEETISIRGKGARALVINTNLILKEDCNALRRYQFEIPKDFYKIKLIGQFLYKDGLRNLTFETPIIDKDYYNYASNFPFISTKNTSYARVNMGQLLSELTGEVFDSRRNDFQCINNLAIEFIAFQYPSNSSNRTIYTKCYLDDFRGYVGAVNDYNTLLYRYNDNPTISLFAPVNAFLSMEIFNGFTFGYLFLIVIGFTLFTLLAKVLKNS